MQEQMSTRVQSLVIVYIVLGPKKMNKLVSFCGNLVTSVRHLDDKWEVVALRKNAEKLVKKIVAFFDEEDVSYSTKEGSSRFLLPFKKVLSKPARKRLGLEITPIGVVFSDCAEKVRKSLIPEVPEEDKAFEKWDKILDELLAGFTEKRQFTARKWLEMTVPVVRNSEA